jgi:precorrin-6A/cobalt-precorrin-6A reductase
MALWLIGGTQESRHCVEGLLAQWPAGSPLLITVTTPSARSLYPEHPGVSIQVGKLNADQAGALIRQHSITAILDASHPFATEISTLAIALAQRYDLPYLRYERSQATPLHQPWQDSAHRAGLERFTDIQQVLCDDYLAPQERTLLTLGRRWLPLFQPWQERTTLFARVLPMAEAVAAAISAGFTRQRLIALHPPVTPALETALWQQWNLTQVITKASGAPGGETTKQAIAAQLGIRLLVIDRPILAYPLQTDCLKAAIAFACDPGATANPLAGSGK